MIKRLQFEMLSADCKSFSRLEESYVSRLHQWIQMRWGWFDKIAGREIFNGLRRALALIAQECTCTCRLLFDIHFQCSAMQWQIFITWISKSCILISQLEKESHNTKLQFNKAWFTSRYSGNRLKWVQSTLLPQGWNEDRTWESGGV